MWFLLPFMARVTGAGTATTVPAIAPLRGLANEGSPG